MKNLIEAEGASHILVAIPAVADRGKATGLWPRTAYRIELFFVNHRDQLVWIHAGMFILFLILILLPLFLPGAGENATPLNDFTRFSNFVIWGLWFPLVFLSVILTGRSWCGLLCPMGAASEWVNLRGRQRAIPPWMRWEGTPLVSFLLITILGQTLGVRDHPEAIAEVFGGTLLAAIATGYLYGRKKRAWCRHLCPIGLLLGVFSRLGIVQFAAKRPRAGGDRYSEKGLCPTMINIPRKRESRHCIECFRCVHPQARGGLYLRFRHPGAEVEQIRRHHPSHYEVLFLFMGTGLSLGGFLWLVLPKFQAIRQRLGEMMIGHGWSWIGDPGPWWLMSVHPERREIFNWLDFFSIVGFMLACMIAITLLLSFTTALSTWLSSKYTEDTGFRQRFLELGYQYSPVAMISLLIGLGAALFEPFGLIHQALPKLIKMILFCIGILWSLRLSMAILDRQGVIAARRWLAALPGIAGSLALGTAWWPGIFGV
jgi:hypothetical protein